MLNSISLSQVTPPECVTQELSFDSRCTFECPRGYFFEGTSARSVLRFCRRDGTWTGEHRPCVGQYLIFQALSLLEVFMIPLPFICPLLCVTCTLTSFHYSVAMNGFSLLLWNSLHNPLDITLIPSPLALLWLSKTNKIKMQLHGTLGSAACCLFYYLRALGFVIQGDYTYLLSSPAHVGSKVLPYIWSKHKWGCWELQFTVFCTIFILLDSEPPSITCPSNIRTNNSLHQDHAVITWVEPAYSDNSIGVDPLADVTVTSNFKSGQKFLIGSHIVQYTVRDKAGLTANCAFTVDVLGQ